MYDDCTSETATFLFLDLRFKILSVSKGYCRIKRQCQAIFKKEKEKRKKEMMCNNNSKAVSSWMFSTVISMDMGKNQKFRTVVCDKNGTERENRCQPIWSNGKARH